MRIKNYFKILDRYLVTEVIGSFFGGLLFFSLLMMMFQGLRLADLFIEGGVPFTQLIEVLSYRLLSDLPLGITVAFLVGILMVFGRLSSDSEIVAMKAGGNSLWRLAKPILAMSVVVSVFSLLLNLNWVPWAETGFRKSLHRIGNNRFTTAIREGTFTSGLGGLLIYTEKANSQNGRMEKVFIFDERNKSEPMTVVSRSGDMIRVAGELGDLQGMIMQLQEGSLHQFDLATDHYNKIDFGTYQIALDFGAGGLGTKPKMYSVAELRSKQNKFTVGTPNWLELETEFWRRISIALSPALFVLLGIGFGVTRSRGAKTSVILVAVIALAIYWQLQVSGIYFGLRGQVPPALAVQLPNLVLGLVGGFFFRKAAW